MTKKSAAPAIRFKGFTDAWEQRKLIEISDIITGTTPPTKDKDNYGGGRLFVSPADIQGNRYVDETITTLTEKGYALGRELRAGTTLFVSIGSTIGKVAQIKESATTNQQINAVVPNDEMDDNFVFTMLENEADKIKKLAATQAVPIINKTTFGETEIQFPKKEEQTRIGKYFSNLDNLITLHQREYDKLTNVKKSMLEKMFPKNGSNYPEIRFKGFTDAWEQRKLGEVATYRRGSFPQPYGKSEWYDGDGAMPFVQVADVSDEMNLVEDTKQKISILAQPMSIFAEKNSVLVTLQGSIGRVAITQYGAFVDRTVLIFEKYKDEIDKNFWAYIIKQKFIDEARKAPGGTIKTITKEVLSDFDLSIPNYQEQKQIGTYFRNLDNLITLHQRELEKLKNLKKACLEKMFV